jgi:hypothetical protein
MHAGSESQTVNIISGTLGSLLVAALLVCGLLIVVIAVLARNKGIILHNNS